MKLKFLLKKVYKCGKISSYISIGLLKICEGSHEKSVTLTKQWYRGEDFFRST